MEPFEASGTRCPGLALSGSEFSGFCLDRGPFGGGASALSLVLATTYDPKFFVLLPCNPCGVCYNVPMNENEEPIEVITLCTAPTDCMGVMEWHPNGHMCSCTTCGHEEIL